MKYLLMLLFLCACGKQSDSHGNKGSFSVWTSSSGDILDLSAKKIGYLEHVPADPSGCTYDSEINGTENQFQWNMITTGGTNCTVYDTFTYTNKGSSLVRCNDFTNSCETFY